MTADHHTPWTIDRLPSWVRWILLLPSSIVVLELSEALIFTVVKSVVVGDNGYGDITEEPEGIKIGRCFGAFFGAVVCMLWVRYVSPSKHPWVLLVSVSLFLVANTLNVMDDLDVVRHGFYGHTVQYALSALGSIFGALVIMASRSTPI